MSPKSLRIIQNHTLKIAVSKGNCTLLERRCEKRRIKLSMTDKSGSKKWVYWSDTLNLIYQIQTTELFIFHLWFSNSVGNVRFELKTATIAGRLGRRRKWYNISAVSAVYVYRTTYSLEKVHTNLMMLSLFKLLAKYFPTHRLYCKQPVSHMSHIEGQRKRERKLNTKNIVRKQ